MDAKPTNPHPPKRKTNHPYREYDAVANRLRDDFSTFLLTIDGRHIRDELVDEIRFSYFLTGGIGLPKIACVGAFPPEMEALVVSKEHPVREVSASRAQRFNAEKMRAMYPEYRGGLSLKVILMNGWELVGKIEKAGQLYVALQLSESKTVHLYRHAIADYEWVDGEPPAVSPEQAKKTQQQRKDLFAHPKPAKKPTPPVVPVPPPKPTSPPMGWFGLLSDAWKERSEVERTMVNAKLKLVLREIPPTLREVGDAIWFPLQNQPGGVPKGFELSSISMELVVAKKMWTGALKKAEEQKQQTGNEALYIVEAVIGTYQNRFCALVSGIQIAEAKPREPKATKPIEPQSPVAKPVEPTQLPKPVIEAKPTPPAQEAKPSAIKKHIVPVVEVIKRPELKPAPEEKPKEPEVAQAKEEKPQEVPPKEPELVAEVKPVKKRVFDLTVDEPIPQAAKVESKAKAPKAKPKPVEVTFVPSSKPKK